MMGSRESYLLADTSWDGSNYSGAVVGAWEAVLRSRGCLLLPVAEG